MAKKSSRSKGYRKYKTEQKGFTKGEIRTLIIGFVVIILAIAAIIYLPDAIEATHLVKVEDGEFVGAEDNWLITNVSDTSTRKYRKLAEVDPAEGYTLDSTTTSSTSNLSRTFTFKAEDEENAAVKEYVVSGSATSCKELSETVYNNFASNAVSAYGLNVTEYSDALQTAEINGKTLYWFSAVYTYDETVENTEEATDETATEETATEDTAEAATEETVTHYIQSLNVYAPADVKGMTVILSTTNDCLSEEEFADMDAMLDVLKDAAGQISSMK